MYDRLVTSLELHLEVLWEVTPQQAGSVIGRPLPSASVLVQLECGLTPAAKTGGHHSLLTLSKHDFVNFATAFNQLLSRLSFPPALLVWTSPLL